MYMFLIDVFILLSLQPYSMSQDRLKFLETLCLITMVQPRQNNSDPIIKTMIVYINSDTGINTFSTLLLLLIILILIKFFRLNVYMKMAWLPLKMDSLFMQMP